MYDTSIFSIFYGLSGFWFIFAWFVAALMTGFVAREKQYSYINWFLLGLFFPGLASIAVIGLPDKNLHSSTE